MTMLFPHLSSTPLGTGRRSGLPGIHSGVWLLPDPWDSNPSVVLTELRTEVSLCCDGSWLYTGSNPVLTGRFAHLQEWRSLHAAADVAPHHRVVPEEWYALFKVREKEFLGSLHVQVYPREPAIGRYWQYGLPALVVRVGENLPAAKETAEGRDKKSGPDALNHGSVHPGLILK